MLSLKFWLAVVCAARTSAESQVCGHGETCQDTMLLQRGIRIHDVGTEEEEDLPVVVDVLARAIDDVANAVETVAGTAHAVTAKARRAAAQAVIGAMNKTMGVLEKRVEAFSAFTRAALETVRARLSGEGGDTLEGKLAVIDEAISDAFTTFIAQWASVQELIEKIKPLAVAAIGKLMQGAESVLQQAQAQAAAGFDAALEHSQSLKAAVGVAKEAAKGLGDQLQPQIMERVQKMQEALGQALQQAETFVDAAQASFGRFSDQVQRSLMGTGVGTFAMRNEVESRFFDFQERSNMAFRMLKQSVDTFFGGIMADFGR